MNKTLTIATCIDCPYLRSDYQERGDSTKYEYCVKEKRIFDASDDDPPAWCPLENAQMCNNGETILRDVFNQLDSYFKKGA